MKKTTSGLLAALAALSVAGTAQAQLGPTTPFSVEVRGGAALPQGDFGDGLDTGWGLGLNASYNFTPMLAVYAGYSFNSFAVEDDGEEFDADVNDRGFDAGLRAGFAPIGGFSPWVRGGLVFHEIEIEDNDSGLSATTDSNLGFEVGGGLSFPLGPRISVTPGVSYTRYTIDDEDLEEDLDVSHLKIDIGLHIRI
ncbi:MAG TPA: porin family protein [Longimicrobium sp.]|jgi:opacity protein-like surface antigen